MDSPGGESGGGFGGALLPLAAFAAGFIAPDRANAVSQNLRFLAEQRSREQELADTRAFREKQFASQEESRKDELKSRELARQASQLSIDQHRAQQQAGQVLPKLQFSKELSVGQPEIPEKIEDVGSEFGASVTPGAGGWRVTGQVPQTIEEMRQQIFARQDLSPDVTAELFREIMKSPHIPNVQPREPEEIQNARQALAAEEFLKTQTDPVSARRMSELVRTGAAKLPQDLINRAVAGDVRVVDQGDYIGFFDLTKKDFVATIQKSNAAQPHVVDNVQTGFKEVLFIDPRTKTVAPLRTDIPIDSSAVVSSKTKEYLAFRSQDVIVPGMPPEIAKLDADVAGNILMKLNSADPFKAAMSGFMPQPGAPGKPPQLPGSAPQSKLPQRGGTPNPNALPAPSGKAEKEYVLDPRTGQLIDPLTGKPAFKR